MKWFQVIFRLKGEDVYELEMNATSYRWAQKKALTFFGFAEQDVIWCETREELK